MGLSVPVCVRGRPGLRFEGDAVRGVGVGVRHGSRGFGNAHAKVEGYSTVKLVRW